MGKTIRHDPVEYDDEVEVGPVPGLMLPDEAWALLNVMAEGRGER